MEYHNPPVDVAHLTTLDDEPWQPVNPRYATQLRVKLLIGGLIFTCAPLLLLLADNPPLMDRLLVGISLLVVVLFSLLALAWIPRRVRHTRYLLRQLDVHVQRGLWWRKVTSVSINRVQHLEITEGPLERMLGLSRLIVYTAGGLRSDLVIPGLPNKTARQLKVQILSAAGETGTEDSEPAGLAAVPTGGTPDGS